MTFSKLKKKKHIKRKSTTEFTHWHALDLDYYIPVGIQISIPPERYLRVTTTRLPLKKGLQQSALRKQGNPVFLTM